MTSRPTRSRSAVVTPGLAASRMHVCISATTRPARRILASSSAVRRIRSAPSTAAFAAVVDGADEAGGDVVGAAHAVHLHQLVLLEVPGDEGGRLLVVQLEAPLNGVFGVVLPLHDLASAQVAGPVVLRRLLGGVVGAAGVAHPATGQALQHDLGVD